MVRNEKKLFGTEVLTTDNLLPEVIEVKRKLNKRYDGSKG